MSSSSFLIPDGPQRRSGTQEIEPLARARVPRLAMLARNEGLEVTERAQ
jgi:hypothetical protein